MEEHVARPLGVSIEEAARGIIRIVDENMLGALRVVSVQRGIDPRELALVPFGGAGPVHGVELARLAGIETVLVPSLPGVLSALGFLLADIRQVFTLTRDGVIGSLDSEAYDRELQRLAQDGMDWLVRERVAPDDRRIEIAVDLRYQGQAYELPIEIDGEINEATWLRAAERFNQEHLRRYGFEMPGARIEVVTLRVTAIGNLPKPALHSYDLAGADASAAIVDERPVYFAGAWHGTPMYDRSLLQPGNRFVGPAVVQQADCTTVVHPGQTVTLDAQANLIIKALTNA